MKKNVDIICLQVGGFFVYFSVFFFVYATWWRFFGSVVAPQNDRVLEVAFWEFIVLFFALWAQWVYRGLVPDIDKTEIKKLSFQELVNIWREANARALTLPVYGIFYALGRGLPEKIRRARKELKFNSVLYRLHDNVGRLETDFEEAVENINKLKDKLRDGRRLEFFDAFFWELLGERTKLLEKKMNFAMHQKIARRAYLKHLSDQRRIGLDHLPPYYTAVPEMGVFIPQEGCTEEYRLTMLCILLKGLEKEHEKADESLWPEDFNCFAAIEFLKCTSFEINEK